VHKLGSDSVVQLLVPCTKTWYPVDNVLGVLTKVLLFCAQHIKCNWQGPPLPIVQFLTLAQPLQFLAQPVQFLAQTVQFLALAQTVQFLAQPVQFLTLAQTVQFLTLAP